MGPTLFKHSVRMVFGNLGDALKVSGGPIIIGIIGTLILNSIFGDTTLDIESLQNGGTIPKGFMAAFFASFVMFIVLFSWVALAWHRYVLLEEYPGLLPTFHSNLILPYFGSSLLIGAIVFVGVFLVGMVVGIVFAMLGPVMAQFYPMFAIVVFLPLASYLWLRMAIMLPAISIQKPLSIRASLSATKEHSGSIFIAGLFLLLLGIIPSVVILFVFGDSFIAKILNVVMSWVSAMVGVAMLTTLYGVTVEGRRLT